MPREAIYREKRGFSLPLVHWMRHELKDMLMILLEPRTLERGYFQASGVRPSDGRSSGARQNHDRAHLAPADVRTLAPQLPREIRQGPPVCSPFPWPPTRAENCRVLPGCPSPVPPPCVARAPPPASLERSHLAATNAAHVTTTHSAAEQIGLFLMINTFETGRIGTPVRAARAECQPIEI